MLFEQRLICATLGVSGIPAEQMDHDKIHKLQYTGIQISTCINHIKRKLEKLQYSGYLYCEKIGDGHCFVMIASNELDLYPKHIWHTSFDRLKKLLKKHQNQCEWKYVSGDTDDYFILCNW